MQSFNCSGSQSHSSAAAGHMATTCSARVNCQNTKRTAPGQQHSAKQPMQHGEQAPCCSCSSSGTGSASSSCCTSDYSSCSSSICQSGETGVHAATLNSSSVCAGNKDHSAAVAAGQNAAIQLIQTDVAYLQCSLLALASWAAVGWQLMVPAATAAVTKPLKLAMMPKQASCSLLLACLAQSFAFGPPSSRGSSRAVVIAQQQQQQQVQGPWLGVMLKRTLLTSLCGMAGGYYLIGSGRKGL